MNEVKCIIPAGMLRDTDAALSELEIRLKMEAEKLSGFDSESPIVADYLKRAEEVHTLADFYFKLYQQREGWT